MLRNMVNNGKELVKSTTMVNQWDKEQQIVLDPAGFEVLYCTCRVQCSIVSNVPCRECGKNKNGQRESTLVTVGKCWVIMDLDLTKKYDVVCWMMVMDRIVDCRAKKNTSCQCRAS